MASPETTCVMPAEPAADPMAACNADLERVYRQFTEEMKECKAVRTRGAQAVKTGCTLDERGREIAVCYDNGVEFPIVWADDLRQDRREREASSAHMVQARRKECFADGFRSYIGAMFSSLPADFDADAAAVARSYADGFDRAERRGGGLLICGPAGVGKTHLAACVCNALVETRRCKMTSIQALEDDHYRINASLRSLLENDLVVIDDFGSERDTGSGRANTFTVFNRLVGDGRPFIVTTALDPRKTAASDLSRKRAMSRVLECCKVVEISGADRRPQAMARRLSA